VVVVLAVGIEQVTGLQIEDPEQLRVQLWRRIPRAPLDAVEV
jgi:hypothetical protein